MMRGQGGACVAPKGPYEHFLVLPSPVLRINR